MTLIGAKWVHVIGERLPEGVEDRVWLGGKGKSLQDMSMAGFPVPPAFVISTEACAEYFAHNEQWPVGLDEQIEDGLAHLESVMGQSYGHGEKPLLVSVRSGGARSMPGMMDTMLNVGLNPTLADSAELYALYTNFLSMYAKTCDDLGEDIFENCKDFDERVERYEEASGREFPLEPRALLRTCIKTVFRSWNNKRAIDYRKRHDIRGLKGTAVTVQAMFPSEVSGICFTIDPTNCESGELVIESSYGLGESVVSGEVAPDRFNVQRNNTTVYTSKIGHKTSAVRALGDKSVHDPDAPSLNDEQLQDVVSLCLQLEEYMGMPLDIEWGLKDGKFSLLQSRAIRGLDVARAVEPGRRAERQRLQGLANARRKLWVSHNLSETLRYPTPMTWDMVQRFMCGDGGFGKLYKDLGYLPSQRVKKEGFLELICGQIYADPERLAELFWDGLPMSYDIDRVAKDRKVLDGAPTRFDADAVDGRLLFRLPKIIKSMYVSSKRMKMLRKNIKNDFDQHTVPAWVSWIKQERECDLRQLNDTELLVVLERRCQKSLDEFVGESLKPGFVGGIALASLQQLLTNLTGETEAHALIGTLTSGLEGDLTAEQDQLLYKVAQGREDLKRVIQQFGHRAVGEMELMNERWWEDPDYLVQTVARIGDACDPMVKHQEKAQQRQAARVALPNQLRQWGGESFLEEIEYNLDLACELLPYRENGKYYFMQGWDLIRQCLVEIGERSGLGSHVFFLHTAELVSLFEEPELLKAQAEQRRVHWLAMQRLDPADIIDSDDLENLGQTPAVEIKGVGAMQGEAMAPGNGSGVARIVHDPNTAGDIGKDYILVCSSTDPGWTPLFLNARGLIVERGGTLSHGAIVARDFGIPAVVLPGACSSISDGSRVRVDGDRGVVQVMEAV